jgi:hypothetical protein
LRCCLPSLWMRRWAAENKQLWSELTRLVGENERLPFQTSDALGAAGCMLSPRAVALATELNK